MTEEQIRHEKSAESKVGLFGNLSDRSLSPEIASATRDIYAQRATRVSIESSMTYGTHNPKLDLLTLGSIEEMLEKMVQVIKGFPKAQLTLGDAIKCDLRRKRYQVNDDVIHSHPVYSAIEKMMGQYRVLHTALCTYLVDMKNTPEATAAVKAMLSEVEHHRKQSVVQTGVNKTRSNNEKFKALYVATYNAMQAVLGDDGSIPTTFPSRIPAADVEIEAAYYAKMSYKVNGKKPNAAVPGATKQPATAPSPFKDAAKIVKAARPHLGGYLEPSPLVSTKSNGSKFWYLGCDICGAHEVAGGGKKSCHHTRDCPNLNNRSKSELEALIDGLVDNPVNSSVPATVGVSKDELRAALKKVL